jgi:uncharacterized membrane protein (DUF106 family)
MADVGGGETAGFLAKAGAASSAGLLWGLFGSMVLIVPGIIMSLFAPLAKKAKDVVDEKVNNIPSSQPKVAQTAKMTKADKEHQRKMDALKAEKEEQELMERLQNLQKKKAKPRTAQASRAQSI